MLNEVEVVLPSKKNRDSQRDGLYPAVAREFPSVLLTVASDSDAPPLVSSSEWVRTDFDTWQFDALLDELARARLTLRLADDRGEEDRFLISVLNRCQRLIGRRNECSDGPLFDRVLMRHRDMHDFSGAFVRGDYNHALDVWQWMLRVDPSAPLSFQIAALFHDVNRLATNAGLHADHLANDCHQSGEASAIAVAQVIWKILSEAGVPASACDEVVALVRNRAPLLDDADALSFFSLTSSAYADDYGSEQARRRVAEHWGRMRPNARAKLASVRLRDDIAAMLRDVRG